jgi:hypothetical protein
MEKPSPRMTPAFGAALTTAVISLALLSGCTATPITLPFNDGGPAQDTWGVGVDAASDMSANVDIGGAPTDAGPTPDDAAAFDSLGDALVDGLCLECPLADGMLDAGSDAEAGPGADAGPSADALVGDLAAGE